MEKYLDEYNVGDIVQVWKYAKQPHNEHNNIIECDEAMIIGKKHSLGDFNYYVAGSYGYEDTVVRKGNTQLIPVKLTK